MDLTVKEIPYAGILSAVFLGRDTMCLFTFHVVFLDVVVLNLKQEIEEKKETHQLSWLRETFSLRKGKRKRNQMGMNTKQQKGFTANERTVFLHRKCLWEIQSLFFKHHLRNLQTQLLFYGTKISIVESRPPLFSILFPKSVWMWNFSLVTLLP